MTHPQTGFAGVNGARVYYEVAGDADAPAVTLLHAGIADSRMWDAAFAALANDYRVLRYDLRGYGQTESPLGDSSLPYSHVDDLTALLDHVGIEQTALIGCSNGGRVAMDALLTHPARFTALVMVCSSPGGFHYEGERPPLWNEIVAASDAGDLKKSAWLEVLYWVVGPQRDQAQVDAAVLELAYDMNLIALNNEYAEVGEERTLEPPAVERLDEIDVPVLVIAGADDLPVSLASADLMMEKIAGARRVTMENTAHLPSMEHPDEFNALVETFMRDVLNR